MKRFSVLCLCVFLGFQQLLAQSDDVIRVKTELVQTDITAVDKRGRVVSGLSANDLESVLDFQAEGGDPSRSARERRSLCEVESEPSTPTRSLSSASRSQRSSVRSHRQRDHVDRDSSALTGSRSISYQRTQQPKRSGGPAREGQVDKVLRDHEQRREADCVG